MTIAGNFFLILSTIVFFYFLMASFKPVPGGDARMGHAFVFAIVFPILFSGSLGILTLILAFKGAFEWISPLAATRTWLVVGGWLSIVFVAIGSIVLHGGGPTPWALKPLTRHRAALVPLAMLFSALVMLNDGLKTALPEWAWKTPLIAVFWISIIVTAGVLLEWSVKAILK